MSALKTKLVYYSVRMTSLMTLPARRYAMGDALRESLVNAAHENVGVIQ